MSTRASLQRVSSIQSWLHKRPLRVERRCCVWHNLCTLVRLVQSQRNLCIQTFRIGRRPDSLVPWDDGSKIHQPSKSRSSPWPFRFRSENRTLLRPHFPLRTSGKPLPKRCTRKKPNAHPDEGGHFEQLVSYLLRRRRATAARPRPRTAIEAGSGTGSAVKLYSATA